MGAILLHVDPRIQPDDAEPRPIEGEWRAMLLGTHPQFRMGRGLFRRLPREPRCKFCASPFAGPAAPLMRLIDKGPWPPNPKYCGSCFKLLTKQRGGAEIPCSLLFADIRGSTTLAESMTPTEFKALLGRFYDAAGRVLVEHDAIVDKVIGDEVFGIFIPALTGDRHAARAVAAAQALLSATGHASGAPWVPVGVGVHTGVAFVGSVGAGENVELTALGDPVNVTARLASAAGAGEVLVTVDAARAAQLDESGLEHRSLELKGKSEPVPVFVLSASV